MCSVSRWHLKKKIWHPQTCRRPIWSDGFSPDTNNTFTLSWLLPFYQSFFVENAAGPSDPTHWTCKVMQEALNHALLRTSVLIAHMLNTVENAHESPFALEKRKEPQLGSHAGTVGQGMLLEIEITCFGAQSASYHSLCTLIGLDGHFRFWILLFLIAHWWLPGSISAWKERE